MQKRVRTLQKKVSAAVMAIIGIIRGRILPANPLSLPASPPRVSGIFGVHVVAVDQSSGAVIAVTVGGSQLHRICRAARRRGSSRADQPIHRYPVPQSHQRSRLAATAGCVVPTVDISFTTRTR